MHGSKNRRAFCLMGPTASGKTEVAISLCKRFPFEVISVDSAQVYRGMDIGTAKPDGATLARVPHRLVDIRDPENAYSAGAFVRDAGDAIADVQARGRVPLLVGGTMMYFRALITGLADLPRGDPEIRAAIDAEAAQIGWPALHARLVAVDPEAAERIERGDSQRIQRALEVWRASGKPLSAWQRQGPGGTGPQSTDFVRVALMLPSRKMLHERIDQRLKAMISNGLVEEVASLAERPGLATDAPSMRAVGYRQFLRYIKGEIEYEEACYRALVATRQLAKRQTTWLRSEPALECFDPLEVNVIDSISAFLIKFFDA